jgi:hypothetical protein
MARAGWTCSAGRLHVLFARRDRRRTRHYLKMVVLPLAARAPSTKSRLTPIYLHFLYYMRAERDNQLTTSAYLPLSIFHLSHFDDFGSNLQNLNQDLSQP